MKLEQSNVIRLRLTELERLDPITVFLEHFGAHRGRITIECFGRSWSSFWPAMGCQLEEFFIDSNDDYLAKNLASQLDSDIYDFDQLETHLKRRILANFFHRHIDRKKAEKLMEQVSDLDCSVMPCEEQVWLSDNARLLSEVYGEDWYYDLPKCDNPEYGYLCRIIQAVREGLKLYLQSKEIETAQA
ncbi:hypothetical protein NDJ81_00140 [Vibrio alginolyticus]|uniref:hypothetical protein n=1 Tax=Vibrio alginolyticus TaxID=663 RepID=UPI00215E7652|nr:hypothetical protein [Vibrio alginolyticus]MCS0235780.1 hypothetical protein [Vibrio alginolyticus]